MARKKSTLGALGLGHCWAPYLLRLSSNAETAQIDSRAAAGTTVREKRDHGCWPTRTDDGMQGRHEALARRESDWKRLRAANWGWWKDEFAKTSQKKVELRRE